MKTPAERDVQAVRPLACNNPCGTPDLRRIAMRGTSLDRGGCIRNDRSERLLEQPPIESHQLAANPPGGEFPLHEMAACLTKTAPKLWIEREPIDRPRKRFDIVNRDQKGIKLGTRDI